MRFENTNNLREVTLEEGLIEISRDEEKRLYSDGLESDEYIYYDSDKGFCYEDGCVLGSTLKRTLKVLINLKWVLDHKFYISE